MRAEQVLHRVASNAEDDKRAAAEERIRAFVARAAAEGGTAIVIPFRVQGFGPYAKVLDGLPYRSDQPRADPARGSRRVDRAPDSNAQFVVKLTESIVALQPFVTNWPLLMSTSRNMRFVAEPVTGVVVLVSITLPDSAK